MVRKDESNAHLVSIDLRQRGGFQPTTSAASFGFGRKDHRRIELLLRLETRIAQGSIYRGEIASSKRIQPFLHHRSDGATSTSSRRVVRRTSRNVRPLLTYTRKRDHLDGLLWGLAPVDSIGRSFPRGSLKFVRLFRRGRLAGSGQRKAYNDNCDVSAQCPEVGFCARVSVDLL